MAARAAALTPIPFPAKPGEGEWDKCDAHPTAATSSLLRARHMLVDKDRIAIRVDEH